MGESATCWCGNTTLAPFSADYFRCASCETLVLRHIPAAGELPVALEPVAETVERCKAIRNTQRERRRLEAALRRELQFNRKVEINAMLRECSEELARLER